MNDFYYVFAMKQVRSYLSVNRSACAVVLPVSSTDWYSTIPIPQTMTHFTRTLVWPCDNCRNALMLSFDVTTTILINQSIVVKALSSTRKVLGLIRSEAFPFTGRFV